MQWTECSIMGCVDSTSEIEFNVVPCSTSLPSRQLPAHHLHYLLNATFKLQTVCLTDKARYVADACWETSRRRYIMAANMNSTIIGVFETPEDAQGAVKELAKRGLTDAQIGVAGHDYSEKTGARARRLDGEESESYVGEGAATGLAAGAGVGALWGLGIIAGAIPAIGPAIAGGTLAAILSSAAAGAAAAGVAGGLIGLGISKDEAEFYESEYRAGKTIVTATAMGREDEVRQVFQEWGANDMQSQLTSTSATATTGRVRGQAPGVSAADTDPYLQTQQPISNRRP
jgi:hypothetical protein